VTLADLFGAGDPDAVLVHDGARQVTRAELDRAARGLHAALVDVGATPGQPVAVLLTGPEAVAALFAVWRAGLVHLPINPRLTDAEVRRVLAAVPVAAAVTGAAEAGRVDDAPVVVLDRDGARVAAHRAPSRPPARYDADVALVQLTSGTTAPPKPVLLRHSAVRAQLDRVLTTLRGGGRRSTSRPPMPNLIPVSLSLWAGIYNVCFAFLAGAPVVLLERFEPREFAALVDRHQVRSVVLPPAAIAMLADDASITSLAPLRFVRSITAPLSPFLARRFHDRFGVDVLNSYGQTELGGEVVGWTAADVRDFGATKLGAVGRPHPGVELRVVDGELQVRTGAALGETADGTVDERIGADGWFRTGDLARIDEDGFCWVEGRVSEMINRGGLKVYPAEVEEVLRTAPGVRDVAVVGVPDARLGEVPVAFVVGAVDPDALRTCCRAELAPYKVPGRFVPVDGLPRNEVGKVVARDLVAGLDA
jgi:acyl-CoA synthetase (AMP-forming)/AMP-acid ligase II